MTARRAIETTAAPRPIGPYSQAIAAGDLVFCAGQIGLDPVTGSLVAGGAAVEAERACENLRAVLAAAGLTLAAVVKTTVYLADMSEFAAMNEVYATYFKSPAPARATIQAARLPRDVRVEIDVVAHLG